MKKKRYFIMLMISACLLQNTEVKAQVAWECPNQNLFHVLVNKENMLQDYYKPENLVIPNVKFLEAGIGEKKHMEAKAAYKLKLLFRAALEEKIELVAISGYRSYSRQEVIYNSNVKRYGQKYADTVSAQAGKSEHQTGLAMDVSAKSVGYTLTQKFGETKEGKWLAANAHTYGFIIRYPKDKESITGYSYEPWHIRYVGEELAAYLYENKLTLEEIETCCEKEEVQVALASESN